MKQLNEFNSSSNINIATKITVTVIGIILAVSGICHGYFEILQGNKAIDGFLIHAIGESNQMWEYGNEPAFTIIPNYMITGIASVLVSIALIICILKLIHKKNGPFITFILFIILVLVGGGIGQIIMFSIMCSFSTRIDKPLAWWSRVLSNKMRILLGKLWVPSLIISSVLILYALVIAVFGFVPTVKDPDIITMVMLISLFSGLIFLILAFISGFAHDIEKRVSNYEW